MNEFGPITARFPARFVVETLLEACTSVVMCVLLLLLEYWIVVKGITQPESFPVWAMLGLCLLYLAVGGISIVFLAKSATDKWFYVKRYSLLGRKLVVDDPWLRGHSEFDLANVKEIVQTRIRRPRRAGGDDIVYILIGIDGSKLRVSESLPILAELLSECKGTL